MMPSCGKIHKHVLYHTSTWVQWISAPIAKQACRAALWITQADEAILPSHDEGEVSSVEIGVALALMLRLKFPL